MIYPPFVFENGNLGEGLKIVLSSDGFGVESGGEGETSSWFCFGLLCCCVAGGGGVAGTGDGRSSGLSGPGDTRDTGPEGPVGTEVGRGLAGWGAVLIELGTMLTEIGRVLTALAASCCGRWTGCWRWGRGCSWVETRLGARGGVPTAGTSGTAGTAGITGTAGLTGTAGTEDGWDTTRGDGKEGGRGVNWGDTL